MNYLIAILSILVVVLFLFVKSLYNDNKQLEENNKLIITAYESSIETLENKAKFEKEILIKKEPQKRLFYLLYSAVNGNNAMLRARLIATVT